MDAQPRLFSAETRKHEYPITADSFFSKSRISKYNFATVLKIKSRIAVLKHRRGLNVLDWGCGNGMWALGLFPGSKITGTDLDNACLKWAELNASLNGSTFEGVLADAVESVGDSRYDVAICFGLIEMLDRQGFDVTFSKIYNALKINSPLIVTFHNWRPVSAAYLPYLFRGGYEKCNKTSGFKISRESLAEVKSRLEAIGFSVIECGGFCPYPSKLWSFIFTGLFYSTRSEFMAKWYYTQYIVLEKR